MVAWGQGVNQLGWSVAQHREVGAAIHLPRDAPVPIRIIMIDRK